MFWLRIALASIVVAVWVADFVVAKLTHGELTNEFSYLLSIVLGGAFGGEIKDALKQRRNGNGNGNGTKNGGG